jgi:natural product precursor
MKKTLTPKKLSLRQNSLRVLANYELKEIVGGTNEGETLTCTVTNRTICVSAYC